MTDLARFSVGVCSWGDPYMICDECCWTSDDLPGDLQEMVDLAEGHRCQRTVDGQVADREIEAASD